jgi:hypothetical protein
VSGDPVRYVNSKNSTYISSYSKALKAIIVNSRLKLELLIYIIIVR